MGDIITLPLQGVFSWWEILLPYHYKECLVGGRYYYLAITRGCLVRELGSLYISPKTPPFHYHFQDILPTFEVSISPSLLLFSFFFLCLRLFTYLCFVPFFF